MQFPETTILSPPGTSLDQSTVGEAIRKRAELQPKHAAMVATGYAPLSYRALQSLIDEVRASLREAGFGWSARIAIAIPSGPQAALAIVAVTCSAVSIPVNPRLTLREVEIYLAALRPDAILLLKGTDSVARQAAKEIGITIIEATESAQATLGFSVGECKTSTATIPDEPDPKAPAFILQSSGTTSEPKLIPFSHSNMLAAASRLRTWFDLTPEDRCLSVSPVFYSHGLKVTVFTPLLTGGTIVFPSDTSAFDFSEWFGFLKPTWYSAGPTLHRLVFEQTQWRADAKTGHSLRFILSGGAPLPGTVLEGLEASLGVPVVEHYGSSEAAQIAANRPLPGQFKHGTCGVPWPGTVRIVGEDGRDLAAGEVGEVLIGGPTLTSGYLNAPELNRACFVDGWFKTGDLGTIDKDGFLTLHGRKNDVINRGGEKISPAEIDELLMRHPAIAEAAAFSIPHSRLGEEVAVAVVLRAGMKLSPAEVRRYLQDKIAPFKIPRRVAVRDQLPKGRTGKIQRRLLTETWSEMSAALPSVQAPELVENSRPESALTSGLLTIWERLLKTAPLSIDDDFFDKGGDSLLAAEMLVDLESLIGKTIPSSLLFEATTIRHLTRKLAELGDLEHKNLVKINQAGEQRPLIYFHGNFNAFGRSAITLSKILGADQPLFVVAPHGTGDEPIPRSIESMAADRLPLILEAQPEGPYRLGGKCLGGIVAFEVARLLRDMGKEVELVVMLDPPTINARKSVQLFFSVMKQAQPIIGPRAERAMAWTWYRGAQLQRFWNYSWDRRKAAVRRRLTALITKVRSFSPIRNGQNRKASTVESDIDTNIEITPIGKFTDARTSRYAAAMSHYVPRPMPVRIFYIKVDFGAGAWRQVSPDLEVVKSSGTHEFIDYVEVAKHLKGRL